MKNPFQRLGISILIFLLFFFQNTSTAQQIKKVGAGEYLTTYLTTDGRLYVSAWTSTIPVLRDFGLSNIIDVDGAQYTNVALSGSGNVYVVGVTQSAVPYANLVPIDYLGNPFTNNSKVYGLYQSYLTLRNGTVWYWGTDDVLNMNNGEVVNAPIQLTQPAGKVITKLVPASSTTFAGSAVLWGLATDGTVWQWDRTHSIPFQVTFPGNNIAVDIAMIGPMAFIILTEHDMYTWGYDPTYAGGISRWVVSGIQSVRSKWEDAGVVFPIKEMVGNYHSLHIIDANDNFFASGANPQGNIGNGIQTNPWRDYNWAWSWLNGEIMTEPVRIPGKVKNICTSNTITFYLYVQDMGGNWYSWGRNKALSLGNGKTLSINDYAIYPDAINVPAPSPVNPLTQTWQVVPFSPNDIQPPMANAGINQYIQTGNTTLYGQGSSQQDGTIVSYLWTKVSGGNANILTPNTMNTTISGLEVGSYIFSLRVTNNLNQTSTATVKVFVSNNPDGTKANLSIDAGADKTIYFPESIITLNGTVPDSSDAFASYQWIQLSGPQGATIQFPNRLVTNVTGLVEGTYLFQLTGTDDIGNVATDRLTVMVIRTHTNVPPVADAGLDKEVQLPNNSTRIVGTGTDSDGTVSAYQWTILSGPSGASILDSQLASTSIVGLSEGEYLIQFLVTDNDGATAADTMKVTVYPAPNVPPVADAGLDKEVQLPNNSTRIVGTGTDSDGTVSAYQWTILSGPSGASILDSQMASTSIVGLSEGEYLIQFLVTDNDGATAADTMKVTVYSAPNVPPVADAGLDKEVQLPNNSTRIVGTGTDSDGTVSAYQWTILSGPSGAFILNSQMASTSIVGLSEGEYLIQFLVTDNDGATAADTMKVTVYPAPNVPPVADAGLDKEVQLPNNSTRIVGTGTDSDGTVSAYQWTILSGPSGASILNSQMASTSIVGLSEGEYLIQFLVTDNDGATAADTMKVTVYPAPNVPPVADAGLDKEVQLPNNSTRIVGTGTDSDGTVSAYQWTILSGPSGASILDSQLASTSIVGLSEGEYLIQFLVTDNDGATGLDTMRVFVYPDLDANMAPIANAGNDIEIILPLNSFGLSGTGTDLDGIIVSTNWSKVSGPSANIVNPSVGRTHANGLVEGTYVFRFTVMDNMGAINYDDMVVTVINPVTNNSPRANAGSDQEVMLPQSSTRLSGWGLDTDGNISSYRWEKVSGPADNLFFKISDKGSRVPVLTGLINGTYQFELTVMDNMGAKSTDTVSIIVVNREELFDGAGLSAVGNEPEVMVSPNPVVNTCNLLISGFAKDERLIIRIINTEGKLIKQVSALQQNPKILVTIDATHLSSGVYHVVISNGKRNLSTQVFKR